MKIAKKFILREVMGDYVAVAVGKDAKDFHGMITLNETGAFLWNALKEETTEAELVEKMLEEYDVSKDVAKKDVERFVQLMKEHQIL